MDLLIKGMHLPKLGYVTTITIFHDGTVADKMGNVETVKAVELPSHGELCDKDILKEATKNTEIRNSRGEIYPIGEAIAKMIDEAPTVLEATE